MIPLFYSYKYDGDFYRRFEIAGIFILLFFAMLFFQAMVVEGIYRGVFGGAIVDFLSVYIGTFGLWTLWLMMVTVSVVLVMEQSLSELAKPLKEYMDKPLTTPKSTQKKEYVPAQSEKEKSIETAPEPVDERYEEFYTAFETPPTSEVTVDIAPSKPIQHPEPIVSEVESTGNTENTPKESTILSMAKKVKESKQHALVVDELEENKILLEQIDKGVSEKPKNFKLPPVDFFQNPPKKQTLVDEAELDDKIRDLIEKLGHFNIDGDVVRTYAGPVVSTFEFKPAANIKVSKILGLQDDLAMALRAQTIRIQAPIPGKDVVGIEIPNKTVEGRRLKHRQIRVSLGRDLTGRAILSGSAWNR